LGGTSEREYIEKIVKIREKIFKTEKDVNSKFDEIEKTKLNSLKKTEEMRRSAEHDLERMEKDIAKSKDLAPESKQRLTSEISAFRTEIVQKYTDLKTRLSKVITPQ
jgi:hypothetical protein